jgi:hypothetical protein
MADRSSLAEQEWSGAALRMFLISQARLIKPLRVEEDATSEFGAGWIVVSLDARRLFAFGEQSGELLFGLLKSGLQHEHIRPGRLGLVEIAITLWNFKGVFYRVRTLRDAQSCVRCLLQVTRVSLTERLLRCVDRVNAAESRDFQRIEFPLAPDGQISVYLKEVYGQAYNEMRSRRDTEFKIVTLFLQIAALLFSGCMLVAFSRAIDSQVLLAVLSGYVPTMVVLWWHTHKRIGYDHNSYRYFSNLAQSIEKHWFEQGVDNLNPARNFGPKGDGYRRMQKMMFMFTLFMVCIPMVTIWVLKFVSSV